MDRAILYMPLLNEGTDVWRPVEAETLADGTFRILGVMPNDEEWAFAPGSIVHGHPTLLSDGQQAVVISASQPEAPTRRA